MPPYPPHLYTNYLVTITEVGGQPSRPHRPGHTPIKAFVVAGAARVSRAIQ